MCVKFKTSKSTELSAKQPYYLSVELIENAKAFRSLMKNHWPVCHSGQCGKCPLCVGAKIVEELAKASGLEQGPVGKEAKEEK